MSNLNEEPFKVVTSNRYLLSGLNVILGLSLNKIEIDFPSYSLITRWVGISDDWACVIMLHKKTLHHKNTVIFFIELIVRTDIINTHLQWFRSSL